MVRTSVRNVAESAALKKILLALFLPALWVPVARSQDDPTIPTSLIAKAFEGDDCTVPVGDAAAADVADLGKGLTLVTIPCWRAAYNFGSILFVLDPKAPEKARLLRFQVHDGKKLVTQKTLSNVSYDEKTRTLRAMHKGRGVGDCGSMGEWKWTGATFRLTGYWLKENCDGKPFEQVKKWRVFP